MAAGAGAWAVEVAADPVAVAGIAHLVPDGFGGLSRAGRGRRRTAQVVDAMTACRSAARSDGVVGPGPGRVGDGGDQELCVGVGRVVHQVQ